MNKKLFIVKGTILFFAMTLLGTTMIAVMNLEEAFAPTSFRAPPAITGDNIYVAWWTNNTANGNEEVNFRASNDGGQTFGDKINLSNTTNSDSSNVEIESDADSIVVSWWETNQTSTTPVMRVSNDNGATFGSVLRLAPNGTIGVSEDEETEEE
ncbi:MAG: hypothetical protein WB053_05410 [Nitrososphaeraceae archaeon]|jgi:hypothetical protein